MDADKSQIQTLGGYFYPFHVIFVICLQSGLNFSYLSYNISSFVVIDCMESPSKWHTLYSSLFLFHVSYSPLPIQITWIMILYLPRKSSSNGVTLPMDSNLDEDHAKCMGNLVA